MVNTAINDIIKSGTDYTKNDLEIYKGIVEEIVHSETGTVSSIQLLNTETTKELESLIRKLELDNWITEIEGGVSLSTRAILELQMYIKDTHPDAATNCNICNAICIKGQTCSSCDVKIQFHCAKRFFQGQEESKCPGQNCSILWAHAIRDVPPSTQDPATPERPSRKRVASQLN